MKAGMVCSIRVNTKDCLAILDLMNVVGIDPLDGRSFTSCTSLALSSLIEVARNSGILKKEEDGFQFLNRMQPFLKRGNSRMRKSMADAMSKRAADGIAAPSLLMPITLPLPRMGAAESSSGAGQMNIPAGQANRAMPLDEATKDMLFQELEELNERKNNGEVLSDEEEDRYMGLQQELGYA